MLALNAGPGKRAQTFFRLVKKGGRVCGHWAAGKGEKGKASSWGEGERKKNVASEPTTKTAIALGPHPEKRGVCFIQEKALNFRILSCKKKGGSIKYRFAQGEKGWRLACPGGAC